MPHSVTCLHNASQCWTTLLRSTVTERTTDQSWLIPARNFGEQKTFAAFPRQLFHLCLEFDCTLGFPGEGPKSDTVTLWSANIGSLRTNPLWKSWGADICCLQETRIGKANLRSTSLGIKALGQRIATSDPLPVKWHKNGSITPCGGTAMIASESILQPFDPGSDLTGLYKTLYATKRVNAAWIQVMPKRRALVASVYAITGASQDAETHAKNDAMFTDILDFTSQFGQIPVVIAGDLQADPTSQCYHLSKLA